MYIIYCIYYIQGENIWNFVLKDDITSGDNYWNMHQKRAQTLFTGGTSKFYNLFTLALTQQLWYTICYILLW